jgi:hypothetical protein
MGAFLGALDNKFDAYLWLMSHDLAESRGIPLKTTPAIQYKKVKDGYLIKFNLRISDCHVTYADVTYYVGRNRNVVLIRSFITMVYQSCI